KITGREDIVSFKGSGGVTGTRKGIGVMRESILRSWYLKYSDGTGQGPDGKENSDPHIIHKSEKRKLIKIKLPENVVTYNSCRSWNSGSLEKIDVSKQHLLRGNLSDLPYPALKLISKSHRDRTSNTSNTTRVNLYRTVKLGHKESTKRQTPNEEEVVNLIQNWRLKDKEVASDASDSELGFDKLERENSVPLKWDNIKTEEVVEIIKDY
ncbi:hypothetical protein RhiirB3_393963, partial [Rhizophagus irregularis]